MLTIAERLLDEAYDKQIEVIVEPHPPRQNATYFKICDKVYIFIRPLETQAEFASLLAEELGHHATAPDFVERYQDGYLTSKAERRARQWAHLRMIPVDRLAALVDSGVINPCDLAEYFGVTEQFLREAVDDFREKGLIE